MCECMTDLSDNIHSRFITFFSKDWNLGLTTKNIILCIPRMHVRIQQIATTASWELNIYSTTGPNQS